MAHDVRVIWFGQLRQEHLEKAPGPYLQTEEAEHAVAELLDQGWSVIASGSSGTNPESPWLAFGYVMLTINKPKE